MCTEHNIKFDLCICNSPHRVTSRDFVGLGRWKSTRFYLTEPPHLVIRPQIFKLVPRAMAVSPCHGAPCHYTTVPITMQVVSGFEYRENPDINITAFQILFLIWILKILFHDVSRHLRNLHSTIQIFDWYEVLKMALKKEWRICVASGWIMLATEDQKTINIKCENNINILFPFNRLSKRHPHKCIVDYIFISFYCLFYRITLFSIY